MINLERIEATLAKIEACKHEWHEEPIVANVCTKCGIDEGQSSLNIVVSALIAEVRSLRRQVSS